MRSSGHNLYIKARFYSSVAAVYAVTLFFAWYIISPQSLLQKQPVEALATHASVVTPTPNSPSPSTVKIVSGKPVRIVINHLGLDLPIDEGVYNPTDDSWSLSGYHAQFATISTPANNQGGNTFIYGHNNKYVFGHLTALTPGDEVQIYTDNGHIFSYIYQSAVDVKPDNLSVLEYQGPPILTIQTCSGNWFEWRRMYHFRFGGVVS